MADTDDRSTEHALRATSDALVDDLERLLAYEREKRTLEPGDPERRQLASEIASIARRVLTSATQEAVITTEAATEVAARAPDAPTRSIDETAPRSVQEILSDWRDAERRASSAAPGTVEAGAIADEIARLRVEYRLAFERASSEPEDG